MSEERTRYEVRNPNTAPPGGWLYCQPETGRQWRGEHALDGLVQKVAAHRAQNELPAGDPREDIMHQTGYSLVQRGMSDRVKIFQPVGRSLRQWWNGMKGASIIAKFELEGRPILVAPETADRRARICIKCPKNVVNTSEKLTQKLANEMIADLVGGRETLVDDQLGTCAVCSCRNATLVHLTGELLSASGHLSHLAPYPSECWKRSAHQP